MRGQLHILIVEDDAPFVKVVEDLVQPLLQAFPGSMVSVAKKLSDALSALSTIPLPNLILLDLTLDRPMSETIARLDRFEETAPTVIVTGYASQMVRELLKGRQIEIVEKGLFLDMKKALMIAIPKAIAGWNERERLSRQKTLEALRRITDAPSP